MNNLKKIDPEIFRTILNEARRENDNLELIASENFVSEEVLEAQGSCLTNKYAEGYPNARWYNGCEFVDEVETLAITRAKELFGGDHVNVQAHSGSQANTAVYMAVLKPGDVVANSTFEKLQDGVAVYKARPAGSDAPAAAGGAPAGM